jgi:flap endonuclease-1
MFQFIDLCILLGCDYCDSIRGIGPKRSIELIQQHGSLEKILEKLDTEKYKVPENWPYQTARRLFNEPDIADPSGIEVSVILAFLLGDFATLYNTFQF